MAYMMVHLLVARRWAEGHPEFLESPEFYYGAIAPDAIHVRDGNDKSHKNEIHLNNWGRLHEQDVIDSIARLLPGSLRDASTREESFENGLLEYPQYTQPAVYEGEAVPEVLRSGNHEKIRRWRLQQSLLLTRKMRPDLFAAHVLTAEEEELLAEADREPDNTVSVE